jgi:hypothetical protein
MMISDSTSAWRLGGRTVSAARPCFKAFFRDLSLPSVVLGPRDLRPFSLEAAFWDSVRSDIGLPLLCLVLCEAADVAVRLTQSRGGGLLSRKLGLATDLEDVSQRREEEEGHSLPLCCASHCN